MTEIINEMIGKVFATVTETRDELKFSTYDGTHFTFLHHQDCCETVFIEDICGDLDDLLDSPIVRAEKRTSENETPKDVIYNGPMDDSYTWTFYEFATNKGSVTVRWLGTSSGYYGEDVDMIITPN